jgi:hypothetical protein
MSLHVVAIRVKQEGWGGISAVLVLLEMASWHRKYAPVIAGAWSTRPFDKLKGG